MILPGAPGRALVACVAALALCGCPEDDGTRRGAGDGELTPGQVIGAARAINVGEIDQASAVQGRLTDSDLSTFVDRIILDHRAALQSLEQVSTQMAIVGEESELTRELQESAQDTLDDLATKQGDELQSDFLAAQLDAHQRALETIDDQLMPSTADPTLQQYLAELRGLISAHLEMARAYEERRREAGATGETTSPQGVPPQGEPAPPR